MEQIRAIWQQGIKIGLIGGVVSLIVALVGMVEAFSQRQIIFNVISEGHTLLLVVVFFFAYTAAKRTTPATAPKVLLNTVFAGLSMAVVLVLLVILGRDIWTSPAFPMRTMFKNASDGLFNLLTLGFPGLSGLLLMLGMGVIIGFLTGAFTRLPALIRRILMWSLASVVIVGVLQELIKPILGRFSQRILELFFAYDGLTLWGAGIFFIVIGLYMVFWSLRGEQVKKGWQRLPKGQKKTAQWIGMAVLLFIIIIAPQVLGLFLSEVLTVVGLYVLLGLGLNIVVGYAGLLDLGYVAFFAIGAYVTALITSPEIQSLNWPFLVEKLGFPWSFWVAVPFAILFGVFAGALLGVPVLKMRGDYLAIATMGFGEIIRLLVLSDALRPWLGGSQGIGKIAKAEIHLFGFDYIFKGPQQIYYLILVGCFLVIFLSWRLKDSRIGRAWKAMREDEDVAQAMGINLVTTKLLAFATGAGFSGLSGAIFASKIGSIYPHTFQIWISINIVCLIIVGGIGSIPGVIVGSMALVGLPELLREFSEYRFFVYGAALVIMMLIKPEGLWPEAIRKREMHEGLANGAVANGAVANGATD